MSVLDVHQDMLDPIIQNSFSLLIKRMLTNTAVVKNAFDA
jgi:hypothetical protein